MCPRFCMFMALWELWGQQTRCCSLDDLWSRLKKCNRLIYTFYTHKHTHYTDCNSSHKPLNLMPPAEAVFWKYCIWWLRKTMWLHETIPGFRASVTAGCQESAEQLFTAVQKTKYCRTDPHSAEPCLFTRFSNEHIWSCYWITPSRVEMKCFFPLFTSVSLCRD